MELKIIFKNIRDDINTRLNEIEQQHMNNQQNLVKIIEQGGNDKLKKSFKRYYLDKSGDDEVDDDDEESEEDEPPEEIAKLPQLIDQHIAKRYKEMDNTKRRAEAERRQMEKEHKYQLPIIENRNMMNVSQDHGMNNTKMRSFYRKETNTSCKIRNKSAFDRDFYQTKEKRVKVKEDEDGDEGLSRKKKGKDKKRKGKKKEEEEDKEDNVNNY